MPLPYFLKASLAITWKLVCSGARIGTGRLCKRLLQKFMGYNGGDLKYRGSRDSGKKGLDSGYIFENKINRI